MSNQSGSVDSSSQAERHAKSHAKGANAIAAATTASDPPLPVVQNGKRLCDVAEGWCQVCEKMSDVPIVKSEELLRGRREVLIVHGNDVYRLLCTRNNKLILQK